MDEKHGRGSMKEDQDRDREKGRQQTPGRNPQSGSHSSGRGSESNPSSNRPGGGSSSGQPGGGSQKGSRGYPHNEEQEESEK